MLRSLMILAACLSLLGCVGIRSDRLSKETRLRPIASLAALTGVFQNQGSSPSGEWRPLLSDVLFPPATFAEPPAAIRFSSPSPTVLRCEAIVNGKVSAARDLTDGRDFRLVDGRVRLAGTLGESGLLEGGVAVSTEVNRLGLTEQGDVVLSSSGSSAGLMLLVVPMAIKVSDDALFVRIREAGS